MIRLTQLLILAVLFLPTTFVHAAPKKSPGSISTPLALSLIPPAQFPSEKFTVKGIRLSAVGEHRTMYGIDVGVIGNKTEQEFAGIAVSGIYNYNKNLATIWGLQLAGITNINKGQAKVFGLQAALGANLSKHTDIYGAQVGLYNEAGAVYGFQIGLINHASALYGVQIGLANFNDNGPFTVSPLLNVGW